LRFKFATLHKEKNLNEIWVSEYGTAFLRGIERNVTPVEFYLLLLSIPSLAFVAGQKPACLLEG
jgi:hypothetical protein